MIEINEGSQKQIDWAKKIQTSFYAAAADLIAVADQPHSEAVTAGLRARAEIVRRMVETAELQSDARWWIDLRTKLGNTVALGAEADYIAQTNLPSVRAYVEQWWWDVA